jgi:hypothetical protein
MDEAIDSSVALWTAAMVYRGKMDASSGIPNRNTTSCDSQISIPINIFPL